ncbi:MAG: hypothetical protein EOP37_11225 [Rubrivivax sp.]|nr:MAG: hypothetical protein EOP37_11225 [Rubrivivax sp.]
MHIRLDSSLQNVDLSSDMTACSGLECILNAVRRGEHFVFGDRKTLTHLQKSQSLSLAARRVLSHIVSNFSTFAPLSRSLSIHVVISYDERKEPVRLSDHEWDVPLLFIGINGLAKAVLVTENLDDANLFEHAARQYATSNRIGCQIALTKLGGGGSTTPDCLMNAVVVERNWVLCISDSDRLHPGQEKDSTAKKCEGFAAISGAVCSYWDIPSREVENIIPLIFFEEAVPPTHSLAWERHRNEIFSQLPHAHHHGDLKFGVSLRKIFSYDANTPQKIFWTKVANDLATKGVFTSACLSSSQCATISTPSACQCFVVQGFGDKLLEAVVKLLGRRSVHRSCQAVASDPNATHWFEIGRRVFEWGFALPRMSVYDASSDGPLPADQSHSY